MSRVSYQLHQVQVDYRRRTVLEIDSLSIGSGAVTAIVGPNGSGKSTLLHLLAFLQNPNRGRVELHGDGIAGTNRSPDDLRKHVTLVAQAPYLLRRSVHANLAYGLKRHGLPLTAIEPALRRVGLADFAKRNAVKLSGGEVQRVALARAIALDTPALLLDEPTANIDAASKTMIEKLVGESISEGKTIVLTTHDLDQAHRLGDVTIALDRGRITHAPRRTVLDGAIRRRGSGVVLDVGPFEIELGDRTSSRIEISADDILVSRNRLESSARNTLRGNIERVERETGTVVLFVDCGEIIAARITEQSFREMALRVGECVYLTFKVTSLRR